MRDPFKGHRFPRGVILLAVRWCCRFPLSYQDVADLLAEHGGESGGHGNANIRNIT